MVVPRALRADERKVKIFIDTFQRDVKAVDFFRCAVFIGDGIGGRLKPFAFVLLCVLCRTEVQIQDLLRTQADVERHLAVFNCQRTHALASFVRLKHRAVRFELCRVHAVFRHNVRLFGGGGLCA